MRELQAPRWHPARRHDQVPPATRGRRRPPPWPGHSLFSGRGRSACASRSGPRWHRGRGASRASPGAAGRRGRGRASRPRSGGAAEVGRRDDRPRQTRASRWVPPVWRTVPCQRVDFGIESLRVLMSDTTSVARALASFRRSDRASARAQPGVTDVSGHAQRPSAPPTRLDRIGSDRERRALRCGRCRSSAFGSPRSTRTWTCPAAPARRPRDLKGGRAAALNEKRSEMVALNADVVGYSRLIADDLEAMTATMDEYRDLVERTVRENGGTLVNFVGDNFMAVFDRRHGRDADGDRHHDRDRDQERDPRQLAQDALPDGPGPGRGRRVRRGVLRGRPEHLRAHPGHRAARGDQRLRAGLPGPG